MKVLILAGGYGTRLYPVVKDTPKALLDVCGKSLIDHVIDKLVPLSGIEEVCVVTNDKFAGLLSAWAARNSRMPFPIRVINDGTKVPEERLGAVGDILFVVDKELTASDWLVAGSDNLFDASIEDFVAFARSKGPDATVGAYDIRDVKAASKYGVVSVDAMGRIAALEEKPALPKSSLISMCLYYFPKEVLPFIRRYVDETHATDTTGGCIQWLYKNTPVYGFKFQGKWYDIGSLESYDEAQKYFLNH
ncbi:MAG: nucleotidyltransferase family protein [Candidatus Omnitrophota bacterium]